MDNNTVLINASIGSKVQWKIWENNTVNLCNNTGIQSFTVTNAFLYEQNTALTSSGMGQYSYWSCQTFQIGALSHSVTSVWLYMKQIGNPNGTITVSIRNTQGVYAYDGTFISYSPYGFSDLTSGTVLDSALPTSWAWIQINITEIQLQANTEYAIIVRDLVAGGGYAGTGTTNCSAYGYATNTYTSGNMLYSYGGSNWNYFLTYDMLFQIVGYPVPTISNFLTDQANTVQNVPFFLNCTISDYRGNFSSVYVEFSDVSQIVASWNSPNTFTVTSGIAYLTPSGCQVTVLNSTSEVITWEITRTGTQGEDVVRVLIPQTLVRDTYGLTGTNSLDKLCSYSLPTTIGPMGPTGPTNPPVENPPIQTTPNPSNNTLFPEAPAIPAAAPVIWYSNFSPTMLLIGVILICTIVAITGFYSGLKKPKTREQAIKLWQSQLKPKNIKWDKDHD